MAPFQFQSPDLGGSFARGLQIREMLEQGRDRDRKRRALEAYEQGDIETYAKLDPQGFAELQKGQRDAQKAELDAMNVAQQMGQRDMEMSARREDNTRAFQERMANALRSDPTTAGRWQQMIEQRTAGRNPAMNAFEAPGRHLLADGLEGPQVYPTDQEIETLRLGAGGKDERTNDQKDFAYGEQNPAFRTYEMAKKKAGGVNVNVGGFSDASKKTVSDQEAAMLKANDTAAMLDELERIATTPDGKVNFGQFLGLVPRGKRFALDVVANVDPALVPADQKPWFDRANQFRAAVGEYKSREYHDMLGGSQTASEIRNLVDVVLSADMSSPAFEAAYAQLRRKTERAQAVASMVLGEGIPVSDPRYRKRFAELERSKFGGGAKPPEVEIKPSTVDLWNKTP